MISSWRCLVVDGEPVAERDLTEVPANEAHQRKIRECLDRSIGVLQAGGNPFQPLTNLPGMLLLEVHAEKRTPYRVFVRPNKNTLAVIGVTRGGDNDSVDPVWRRRVTRRLEALTSGKARLAKPESLGEQTVRPRTTNRGRSSRAVQRDQAKSNVSEVVFGSRTPTDLDRQRQVQREARIKPISHLLAEAAGLNRRLHDPVVTGSPERITLRQQEVREEIELAKAEGRDRVREWSQEQKALQAEIEERGLKSSPLDHTFEHDARVDAGIAVLLQREALRVAEIGAER